MRLDFCVACGNRSDLNHHHLVPRVYDGPDDDANLVTLCRECHGLAHGAAYKTGHGDLVRYGQAAARLRGVKVGRKPKLSDYQRDEAIKRRAAGEALADIAKSYGVHLSMISRL